MGPSQWRSFAKNPVPGMVMWFKRQPIQQKILMGVVAALLRLVFMRLAVRDHNNLFVASKLDYAAGIVVLIYKLIKEKNTAGN
jgi:hypothetical protein